MAARQARSINRARPRRWLWLALTRVGLPIALLGLLLWWRLDALVDRQLQPLRSVADVQRGASFLNWRGEVGVRGLQLSPRPDLGPPGLPTLRAARVAVQTPGLGWLLRAMVFGPPEALPRRLGFSVANLEFDGIVPVEQGGFIGGYSGIPFEAAGCGVEGFSRQDLQAMGLPPTDTVLALLIEHADAGVVNFSINLHTPGVGQMQGRIGVGYSDGGAVRADALALGQLVEFNWSFIDEGFVAARNNWCTDRVTTSLADFNRVHLDGVRAVLRTIGLQPDADLLLAFGHFAARGGEFRIETRPGRNLGLLQLGMMQPDQLMQALAPYVRVTGVNPVRFAFARVRPMSLRDQQRAQQVAMARLQDGIPLDPELEEMVGDPPRVPEPQVPRPQVPLPARDGSIGYADLGPYVGREIEITTVWGSRRRGQLVDFAQARILIRLRNYEGGFDLNVPAETITSVRLLDAAAIQPDSSTDLTDAQAN
ncbi:MAG: hypothetical protein MEQ07_07380 [Aquimonas sp.]|nr:hypothetical protein [Aquimonas sp.]